MAPKNVAPAVVNEPIARVDTPLRPCPILQPPAMMEPVPMSVPPTRALAALPAKVPMTNAMPNPNPARPSVVRVYVIRATGPEA